MKTKYFRENGLSKEGKENLSTLLGLSTSVLDNILDWFQARTYYPRFDHQDIGDVSSLTDESGDRIISAISILKLLISRIIAEDDPIENYRDDIVALGLVQESEQPKINLLFSRLPAIVEKFRLFHRRTVAEGLGMPRLSGSSMSAAIKPIYGRTFRSGVDDLKTYDPIPMGYAVVAQILLERDGREEEMFCFQMNRDNLNRFVSDLLALQAEVEKMHDSGERLSKAEGLTDGA